MTPEELRQMKQVRASSLSPCQHRASRDFRMATSYWVAPLSKLPGEAVGEFHSYAEYLNGGLAEGNAEIDTFIPQPYTLRYQGKSYKPDALEIHRTTQTVVELKPKGKFDEHKHTALRAFFKFHQKQFEVRDNESVLNREWEALNWWMIAQQLTLYQDLDTDAIERQLLIDWPANGISTLGDCIDPGDREGSILVEAALFRLAHRGWLQPKFDNAPLDYDTEFHRCLTGDEH